MTILTVIAALLGIAVVLLFLCWVALRGIWAELMVHAQTVSRFTHDYRTLNNFEERLKLNLEIRVDEELSKGMAKWKAEHPES